MARSLPVVFLHAFPLDGSMWIAQEEAFREQRLTFAPHMPGFGGQPVVAGDLAGFADHVVALCDEKGIERAVFVGLSMGGYVAMRLADRHPHRVAGLVLADTRAGPDDEEGRAKRSAQIARVRSEGCDWLAEAMIPALLGETTRRERPQVVESVEAMIGLATPEGVASALEAMRDRPDSSSVLSSLEVPTLAVVGREDVLTPPAEAERIAKLSRRSRAVVIADAGHLANLEQPQAFNDALEVFLRELD